VEHLTIMILSAIDNFTGDFSISDIERACPLVGRDMIRCVLNKVRGEERVFNLPKGRNARWRKEVSDEDPGAILHFRRVIAMDVCSFPIDFPVVWNKRCIYRIDTIFGGSTWVELPES
jgi:hypothetical protein